MKASDPSVKMIRTRRLWRRLGFAAVLMALGWILFARLKAWNNQGELRLAQQEIARGELASAHRRLAALAARPGSLSGAADYWLGVTESLAGRPQAALEAFGQVPKGFAFGPVGAYHEARANLRRESCSPPSNASSRSWHAVVRASTRFATCWAKSTRSRSDLTTLVHYSAPLSPTPKTRSIF